MSETKAAEVDEGRLQRAVELLAISQEDARKLVEGYRRRYGLRGPNVATDRKIAKAIVARYSSMAATSGAASSAAGVIPGIGTVVAVAGGGLADVAICLKLQVDMCRCLIELFDHELSSEDRKHLAIILALAGSLEQFGAQAGGEFVHRAGVRMVYRYLTGPTLVIIKELFRKVGIVFTQKAAAKAIPLGIGVAFSASTNYALSRFVGRKAISFFDVRDQMRADGEVI